MQAGGLWPRRGRTDDSIRLRATAFLMFSLALKGASTDVAWIRQESSRIRHLWRLTDSEVSSLFSGSAYPCNKVAPQLELGGTLLLKSYLTSARPKGGLMSDSPALTQDYY